jgi:hypothetical protein
MVYSTFALKHVPGQGIPDVELNFSWKGFYSSNQQQLSVILCGLALM